MKVIEPWNKLPGELEKSPLEILKSHLDMVLLEQRDWTRWFPEVPANGLSVILWWRIVQFSVTVSRDHREMLFFHCKMNQVYPPVTRDKKHVAVGSSHCWPRLDLICQFGYKRHSITFSIPRVLDDFAVTQFDLFFRNSLFADEHLAGE